MLKLKNITKIYETTDLSQKALDDVSVNFRKSEFVSILGQSGSGKTTLLNIIGGLDQYSSGDLVINGVSTKKYCDRDWDVYRNHKVGFVFQNYNLISHQSVLSNVELALTLSGVSKSERRKRAKKALKDVGLIEHINKKPNQLSGGQMQRVAIARALINDPEIILADEPTGALDSSTSVQIMELLKKISLDKLVIMVTHNPELAHEYSNRIIELKDGKIISDSNSYEGLNYKEYVDNKKNNRNKKNSMSFKTAFELSLKNLMTKKGRTFLTAFAGSIGIIGIAVILSVSTGVNKYISKTEEETLSSYPITIEKSTIDLSGFVSDDNEDIVCDKNTICSQNMMGNLISATSSNVLSNNLSEFKKYLDSNSDIKDITNDIKYKYGFNLEVYLKNSDSFLKVNPSNFMQNLMGNSMMNQSMFKELVENDDLLNSQYDILKGRMPREYNEIVLIVDKENKLTDYTMYALGLKDQKELANIKNGEFNNEIVSYSYDDILDLNYKLVLNTDYYEKNGDVWIDKSNDINYINKLVDSGLDLKVVGILKPNDESAASLNNVIGYRHDLVEYVINKNNESLIAREQTINSSKNVFTGTNFDNITSNYDLNLQKLGVASLDNPYSIELYPKSFEDKEKIEDIINSYNSLVRDKYDDDRTITYTDYVGIIMSGVTSILDVITIVLIGFVSVSLVVSSIMIAIITYISVLERTKEIGILRAIGASKKDISRVFNAETFIEGLVSGILGIGVTLGINLVINIIVKKLVNVSNVAYLEMNAAIVLVIISVLLTVVAGFVPAKMASKRNPVESLRSE